MWGCDYATYIRLFTRFACELSGVVSRHTIIFIDTLSLILHFISLDFGRKTMKYASFNVHGDDALSLFVQIKRILSPAIKSF